jgi:two-component sensor histidine kinase/PAS domain-containing protein
MPESLSAKTQFDLDLDAWRNRTLANALRAVAIVAVPAVLGGMWLSIQDGLVWLAVFDAVAWLVVAGLARGLGSYRVRASLFVAIFALVGLVALTAVGASGVGHIWLTPAPMLGGLFFGRRGLVAWLGLIEAAVLVLALFSAQGSTTEGGVELLGSPAWWVMVAASVACIALAVGLPMVQLVEGLARSQGLLRRARDDARALQQTELAERRRFESLFTETPASLLLVERGGRIVRFNHAAGALFGDIETSSTTLSALLDSAAVEAAERACLDPSSPPGSIVFAGAASGHRLPGERLELELRIVAIDNDGRPSALIGALDVGARVAAERQLETALGEKVTLLQEVHHRVKNNLQIVSGMLDMQAAQMPEGPAQRALLDSTHRVRSMALVHQQLYGGDTFSKIDLAAYTETLVSGLCRSLAPDAIVDFDLAPLHVSLESAMPCGLILNELVTNALKHGRDASGRCQITVSLRSVDQRAELVVADRGPGLSAPWKELGRRSLGGRVVAALVRQLRAELQTSERRGARFCLSWDPAAHDESKTGPIAARAAAAREVSSPSAAPPS